MRMGAQVPKQYLNLGNISVLEQSIRSFLAVPGCGQSRLVCDPSHAKWFQDTVQRHALPPPALCGKTRKESVFNGINNFSNIKDEEIILIHDAARPFAEVGEIQAVAMAAARDGAATLALPVADTLRRDDGSGVDRNGLWAVQTPQAFRYGLIRDAHLRFADDDSFTDDAGLAGAAGHAVTLVPGNRRNFKITTQDDLELARTMTATTPSPAADMVPDIRTGFGFDVHAFDPVRPGPVILGGVAIPHGRGLAGHSDADVGLHALTDALLSTLAAGDIGTHFPPSDPQWKGADSRIFLSHAVKMLNQENAAIKLIDITFMCEEPKIGPHREAMQRVIAEITGLQPGRISIKATTTEKLGFTSRGEGIAAQATATVFFPSGTTPR